MENTCYEEVDLTTKGVMKKLQELNSEKSPGNDSIYPAVLQNLWGTVAHPLKLRNRRDATRLEDCKRYTYIQEGIK